jgi:predicted amidophosphoribosyltransferase
MTAVAQACASALREAGQQATVAAVLRLSGRARDSMGLGPEARAANLRGRLHCTGPAPEKAVLVDDVITTGATAMACSAALAAAGTKETAVLAFTATT